MIRMHPHQRAILEAEPFEVRDLLAAVLQIIAIEAQGKNLKVSAMVDTDVPTRIIGDAGRLRQMLLDLCRNAVKFTQHGEVSVWVVVDACAGEGITLRFAVQDTGDASKTRLYGGMGGFTVRAAVTSADVERLTLHLADT